MNSIKIKKVLPTVLTCISSAGVLATAFLSSKATIKAREILKATEKENGEKLDKVEAAKLVIPVYTSAVLMGTATVACIIGSNIINKKQQAALASAYALLNRYHKEYRTTVKEVCGETADKKVQSEMLRQRCNYRITDLDVPDQKVIFYDDISGNSVIRYERDIIDAEYHLNRNFAIGGHVLLNDLYEMLGMPKTEDGEKLGWSCEDGYYWIDFEHRPLSRDESGMDVYVIDMIIQPCPESTYE